MTGKLVSTCVLAYCALSVGLPYRAHREQKPTVYLDALPSWHKTPDARLAARGLEFVRELQKALSERGLSVVTPGDDEVEAPLEARTADVWRTQMRSGTTTYVAFVLERGEELGAKVYYPPKPEGIPETVDAHDLEAVREVASAIEAADKAEESEHLARLIGDRLGALFDAQRVSASPMADDFLLDSTPGPAVVVTLVVRADAEGSLVASDGAKVSITVADAIETFLQSRAARPRIGDSFTEAPR